MQAVLRRPARALTQSVIRRTGAVAGGDAQRLGLVQRRLQAREQIVKPHIHDRHFIGGVVAQQAIQYGHRLRLIDPVGIIDVVKTVIGPRIMQREPSRPRHPCLGQCRSRQRCRKPEQCGAAREYRLCEFNHEFSARPFVIAPTISDAA